ncbi:hypothetical protein KC335_g29 [Hortaea werneckii]|nr:hypothetical protein KC335_g29 [Hortaea werneckii]
MPSAFSHRQRRMLFHARPRIRSSSLTRLARGLLNHSMGSLWSAPLRRRQKESVGFICNPSKTAETRKGGGASSFREFVIIDSLVDSQLGGIRSKSLQANVSLAGGQRAIEEDLASSLGQHTSHSLHPKQPHGFSCTLCIGNVWLKSTPGLRTGLESIKDIVRKARPVYDSDCMRRLTSQESWDSHRTLCRLRRVANRRLVGARDPKMAGSAAGYVYLVCSTWNLSQSPGEVTASTENPLPRISSWLEKTRELQDSIYPRGAGGNLVPRQTSSQTAFLRKSPTPNSHQTPEWGSAARTGLGCIRPGRRSDRGCWRQVAVAIGGKAKRGAGICRHALHRQPPRTRTRQFKGSEAGCLDSVQSSTTQVAMYLAGHPEAAQQQVYT